MVPKVTFWGFWGLVCIEKWSYNFDSGTRSAISGTPKMAKWGRFSNFGGTRNGTSDARIKIAKLLYFLFSGSKIQPGNVICFFEFLYFGFLTPPSEHGIVKVTVK